MNTRLATTVTAAATTTAALGIALALAPAPTPAPGNAPGNTTSPAPTVREATAYAIDPVHSSSIFRVHHFNAGMFRGMFDHVTGTIEFDPDDLSATTFDVAIDVESIHTGSEPRNQDLNNHLMSPDFFNAKEHPQLTFKSTSVELVDDDTLKVTGDLTIHGVTKPVTTNVDLTGHVESPRGKLAGFETIFTIDRTDYDMTYGVDRGVLGREIQVTVVMECGAS